MDIGKDLQQAYADGYAKAIDEFAEKIKFNARNKWVFDLCSDDDNEDFNYCIDEIAEQLKGVRNE